MATYDNTTAEYRYFVVNLVDNKQIAEIPFKGVSYERALKGAGAFGGNIAISDQNAHLSLYESTMPGRTALYVVRDGVAVWGGIIWGRSYNVNERVLNVSASEFTSYFYHRRIWKTWGQEFQGTLVANNQVITATLNYGSTYAFDVGSTVRFVFFDTNNFKYNGYYVVTGQNSLEPTRIFTTATTAKKADSGTVVYEVPNGTYTFVSVYAKTNTYDYVRTLINAMSEDFALVDFPNDEIEPALRTTVDITQRSINGGIAVINTANALAVVPGQEVNIRNLSPLFDGTQIVNTVDGSQITINKVGGTLATANVTPLLYRLTSKEVFNNTVSVTTNVPHQLYVGQDVTVSGLDALDSTTDVLNGTFEVASIPTPSSFKYVTKLPAPNNLPLALSTPTATSGTKQAFLTRQEVATINTLTRLATLSTGESLPSDAFAVGSSVTVSGFKDYTKIIARSLLNRVITYTTSARHYYQVGKSVSITGLADVSTVTSASMTVNTTSNVATFTVTTSTPHNLVVGNTIAINSMVDSYNVSSYNYYTTNSTLVLTTSASHNINKDAGQSVVISGLPTTPFRITSLAVSNGTATATTNVAHGFTANDVLNISGLSKTLSWTITSLARKSNVVTCTTDTSHGLNVGDVVDVYPDSTVPSDYTGYSVSIASVPSTTTFTYSSFGDDSASTVPNTGTAKLLPLESYYWRDGVLWDASQTSVVSAVFDNKLYVYNGGTGTTTKKHGAIRFESLDSKLPSGVTIADLTSVTAASLTLTRITGLGFGGAQASIVLNGDTNLSNDSPAGRPPSGLSGTDVWTQTGWNNGVTRTLNMPTNWRAKFLDGTARGISVGFTGLSTLNTPPASTSAELIGFIGHGPAGSSRQTNYPYMSISYSYLATTGSSYSGTNIGRVEKYFSGLNSSSKAVQSVPSTTTFTYSTSSDDFSSTAQSGTVYAGTNPLNGTYNATDIASRTNTTLTINKGGVASNRSGSGLTAKITTSSNFNTLSPAVANVTAIISPTTLSYQKTGVNGYIVANVSTFTPSPAGQAVIQSNDLNVTANITSVTNTTFTVNTTSTRTIAFANASPVGDAVSDSPLAGTFTISSKTPSSFSYQVANTVPAITGTPIYGYANTSSTATLTYGTYGPYKRSSDIGIEFSTTGYSTSDVNPVNFRGYEVRTLGEELDKYSDIINGFEYRVDVVIDPATGKFSRIFKLLPIIPDAVKSYIDSQGGEIPLGTSIPLTYYGADKLVFEYPGNISDLQLEESAENSATRFFMVGNIGDLGDDISQPYAVATASDLLTPTTDTYPWPLLDDDESLEDVEDENTLYAYAERYLLENRPPDGKFTITVNGSVEPIVGSYSPGDWCSLIINDDFIKQRLASDLEPRSTVLLRKINSFSVSVPDSVTFPETISLNLIPEWQVDKRGK